MIIRFVLPALGVAALLAFTFFMRNISTDWARIAPKSWLVGGTIILALGILISLLAILYEWLGNRGGVIGKEVGQKPTSFWDIFNIL